LGQPASGSWALKPVRLIGTRSADYIRASGHGAAQTGRTHDLHPTASQTSDSSCNAGVVFPEVPSWGRLTWELMPLGVSASANRVTQASDFIAKSSYDFSLMPAAEEPQAGFCAEVLARSYPSPPFGLLKAPFGRCGAISSRTSAQGHVWTTPALQEESDVRLAVGCKSCVRPVCAAP